MGIQITLTLPERDVEAVEALPVTGGRAQKHKYHNGQISLTLDDGTELTGNFNVFAQTADEMLARKDAPSVEVADGKGGTTKVKDWDVPYYLAAKADPKAPRPSVRDAKKAAPKA